MHSFVFLATFLCLSVFASATWFVEWEGQTNSISCPDGEVVTEVHFSSYGRALLPQYVETEKSSKRWAKIGHRRRVRHRFRSEAGPKISERCHADNSFSIVQSMCYGKQSCEVRVANDVFGDPCRKRTKYLAVQVKCGTIEESEADGSSDQTISDQQQHGSSHQTVSDQQPQTPCGAQAQFGVGQGAGLALHANAPFDIEAGVQIPFPNSPYGQPGPQSGGQFYGHSGGLNGGPIGVPNGVQAGGDWNMAGSPFANNWNPTQPQWGSQPQPVLAFPPSQSQWNSNVQANQPWSNGVANQWNGGGQWGEDSGSVQHLVSNSMSSISAC